jgi:prepilin-type N-terminal cleavage/methylation domain-containing protein
MPGFRRSRGFTLIELLLAIGISLLIAVGVLRVYQSTDRDTKVKETYSLVELLLKQANLVTALSNDYTVPQSGGSTATLSTTLLLSSVGANTPATTTLYPVGTSVSSTEIFHPFNGHATVQTESSVPGGDDLVAVRLEEIPQAACLSLLQRMSSAGLYDMWVDAGSAPHLVALSPAATANAPGRQEVVISKAVPLCNAADRSTLTFRMLKPVDITSMRRTSFGDSLSAEEIARIQPLYDRQQAAMAAREAAQLSL